MKSAELWPDELPFLQDMQNKANNAPRGFKNGHRRTLVHAVAAQLDKETQAKRISNYFAETR